MGMGKVSGKICRLKKDEVKRYDFAKKVKRPRALRPLTYFISKIFLKGRVRTYDFQKMEGLKPPYLILANHSSMLDFALAVDAMWPVSMTYVAALDSIFDFTEFLMRRVGIIAKRKFIKDLNLLKNLKYSVTKIPSCPTMMYPEAKYSLEGCTSYIPESVGKLAKFLDVPVVTMAMHGCYIGCPQWRKTFSPKSPLALEVRQIVTQEEVKTLPAEEIFSRVKEALTVDDFRWQQDNQIVIDMPDRARNLNALLYQCPHCGTEFEMRGEGAAITCEHCGASYELTETGRLKAINCEEKFNHVPDWVKWQTEQIRAEIEGGRYAFEDEVDIYTMPNAKTVYYHGKGKLTHDETGLRLTGTVYGEPLAEFWPAETQDGVHIEYLHPNFKGRDMVDLSTAHESYWLAVSKKDQLTKLSFANDILYARAHRKD